MVPSMLMTKASPEVLELIQSSNVPALVVHFHDDYLPAFGLFHRLVIYFVRWCAEKWGKVEQPQLYKNCARLFLGAEGSEQLILACGLHVISFSVTSGKEDSEMSDADARYMLFSKNSNYNR